MTDLIQIPIIVTHKNNKPAIELRRLTSDDELIKLIVSAAYYKKPITIQPCFIDTFKGVTSLVDKGILYYNKDEDRYYFTF